MAESIIESKIYAKYRKKLQRFSQRDRGDCEGWWHYTPQKKRFAEIYSDDYLERLRNLRIKSPYLPPFFRFPMATTAAWVCTAVGYLLSVLKPIGL